MTEAGEPLDSLPGWPRHLLDVAGMSQVAVEEVMRRADEMASVLARPTARLPTLQGRRVTILFYEASTRTRVSFEIAAKALSADVVNITVAGSSVTKGESLIDTVRTIEALGSDVLVLRHSRSGAPYLAAQHFGGHIVNAGDGWHAHPTQALLDLYTLRRHLGGKGGLRGRKIVILGDILHSRVARSNVWTLTGAGAHVWLCGPPTLIAGFEGWARAMRIGDAASPASDASARGELSVTSDLDWALREADAVMCLRLQRERQEAGLLPSLREYSARYALTAERLRLAHPEAVVLHPGPMNEGTEIAPEVVTSDRSLIGEQVANGVAVRMALLSLMSAQA